MGRFYKNIRIPRNGNAGQRRFRRFKIRDRRSCAEPSWSRSSKTRNRDGPAVPKRGTAVASDFSTVQHNLYTVLTLYSTVHTLCMPGAAPLLCGIDMEL